MMKNIFFLRMDKDIVASDPTFSPQYPYIHSVHGTCGNRELIKQQASIIFPRLELSERELLDRIYKLKQELIANDDLDEKAPGKQRCDLAIKYWLKTMQVGDVVFVRNQANQLYLCQVASYVQKGFFDEHGCFQRKVENVQLIDESSVPSEIINRTYGRKTIEKNACEAVKTVFVKHFGRTSKAIA
ncbi:hypothetical protein [Vibrio furnissii]|uniref:Uncharacterized protein n=1 Tax=Vibrio furnissii TaxID=29494 RepID=A0A0Q2MF93_VIBFU|nr:hypothetical protein [Vibrio furnissii]KQH86673.1 hypothetical protein AMR76_06170 [Vibrio furnissii]TRN25124.1 hypothetical protein DM784_12640 [Vibrio furnissii]